MIQHTTLVQLFRSGLRFSVALILTVGLLAGTLIGGGPPAIAAGCPNKGSVCFYDSPNFKNFLSSFPQTSCDGTLHPLPDGTKNKVESIRNRTGCYVIMYENIGRGQVCLESIRGGLEADHVADPNQYDWYAFSRIPLC